MRRHIETGRVEVGQAKVSSTWQHNNAEGKATLLHLGIWRLAPVVIDDDAGRGEASPLFSAWRSYDAPKCMTVRERRPRQAPFDLD